MAIYVGKGVDFDVVNETLELGELCVAVNITIVDDTVYEANEVLLITATYEDSLSATNNTTSATITILDDES